MGIALAEESWLNSMKRTDYNVEGSAVLIDSTASGNVSASRCVCGCSAT